jgi:ubiquinone/menaquinone biosynthesis C-methylase UbiE/uncharacterized protein YbaR (Trm112 family)
LREHAERELITNSYLKHQKRLAREALRQVTGQEEPTREFKEGKMATTAIDREIAAPEKECAISPEPYGIYACPACKQDLEPAPDGLSCRACGVSYPIRDGIPDFIVEKLEENSNRSLRVLGKRDSTALLDLAAYSYEKYIYPPVCNLFGGWHSTSLKELAREITDIVGSQDGVILDVACGPGTYGRRIASTSRTVYGIDASMSMLRRGARYIERESIPNVHLARAKVEALPFQAGLFDAAVCAGSLNHFSDTLLAMREINRTMKGGAPLAVMCFVVSGRGLLKYKFLREHVERGGGHIFELADLERYVVEAGFEGFSLHANGAILVFGTHKRPTEY